MENNQEKHNVFCVGCYGWQEQIYKGDVKDGKYTYKRYVCCQCGMENNIEDKNKHQ